MGLFDGRKSTDETLQVRLELERVSAERDFLRERVERLEKQVDCLQNALISKEAPRAYADLQADRAPDSSLTPEENERLQLSKMVTEYWMDNLEKPMFDTSDPTRFSDDLEYLLASRAGQAPMQSVEAVNSES